MKRIIGALATLALLSTTTAWAATDTRVASGTATLDRKQVQRRVLPNFDHSSKAPTRKPRTEEAPRFIWNRANPQTAGRSFQSIPPAIAANVQLSSLARAVGAKDVRTLGLTYASQSTNALGQRFVRYEQRIDGIEVFRSGAVALLDREHQLVALSNRLSRQAFGAGKVSERAFELSAREAISIGYEDMIGAPMDQGLFRAVPSEGEYVRYGNVSVVARKTPFLPTPARAKKVFFPSPDLGLIPAWYVEVQAQHPGSVDAEGYAYVVAARGRGELKKGDLLLRHNLMSDADLTFRVWADTTPPYTPLDNPTGSEATPYPLAAFDQTAPYQSSYVTQNLVVLPNGVTDAGRDPWFEPGDDFSYSNHAFAYADLQAPDGFTDGADIFVQMNVPGSQGFDYTWDPNLGPDESAAQIQAAITQLLYTNHWLHDFFYEAGFDEVSGNAQWSNFGRGGLEGDAIHAQAQDHSGTDNANMLTPADGSSPRMQMYLFNPLPTLTLEVLQPAGLTVGYAHTSVGPQVFDLTLEVVDGAPDPATCTFPNEAELVGKAVIIPWLVGVPGCSVVDLLTMVGDAGGALTLLDFDEPSDPDFAPVVIDDPNLSAVPLIILSYNGAQALRSAATAGTVQIHAQRLEETMIDGTIDNAIVAHEWGHYLTNRLVGNGSGLGTNQARSMGEGWSDFVSLLMTTRPEDHSKPENNNWEGAFPVATYATRGFLGEWADYFGIRRIPYSVDRSKNALTFKHIEEGVPLPGDAPMLDFGNSNAQFHNSGEVWATALWEAYVSLLRAHPFLEAQNRMKNYLVAGLKLTPIQPTFTEARDALLAAAEANDPADFQRMAEAFASRGMGSGAVSPDRYSTDHAGVVESYELDGRLDVVDSELIEAPGFCDDDGILDNGEDGILRLTISNRGWSSAGAGSVTVTSSTPELTILTPTVPVSALNRHGEEVVEVSVRLEGATGPTVVELEVTAGETGATTQTHTTLNHHANYDWGFSATETLAAPDELNWTHEHDPALAHFAFELASFDGTFESIGFHGINPSVAADFSLVSPVLEVGQDPLILSFDHFYIFDHEVDGQSVYVFDGGVIELSVNGGEWVDIGGAIESGPYYQAQLPSAFGNPLGGRPAFVYIHPGYPDLATTTVDLGTAYAGQNVRVRFRIGSDDSFGATGWYIDEIRFSGITNTPFKQRLPDQTVCGVNQPPTADAGEDFSVEERSTGTLQGVVSDPDGLELLTVTWTQVSGPPTTLDTPNEVTTTFTAPEVTADTQATFKLTVTDGEFTEEDEVVVTIVDVNRAPVADAGEAFNVNEREEGQLQGSGTDPDGDAVTYSWTQIAGPPTTLNTPNAATTTFTAPEVTADTEVTFELTVSDGDLSSVDTVVVTIVDVNRAPVAEAGADVVVNEREVGELQGSGTDPDGDVLSYAWTQVSGPPTSLATPDAATTTFLAPEVTADTQATFKLTVSDGELTAEDTVVVTIVNVNRAPVADAGEDFSVNERESGALEGSGVDPDGDAVTYAWSQVDGPTVTLDTPSAATTTFTAPDVEADTTATFKLTVSDGTLTGEDTVVVTIVNVNRPPVADAGEAQRVLPGAQVNLTGGGVDPDGDVLTFAWSQVSGETVTLDGAATSTPSFTAPEVTDDVELVFALVVSDGDLASEPSEVVVTVAGANAAPVVTLVGEANLTGVEGSQLTVAVEVTDADGDEVSVTWSQVSGPSAILENGDTAEVTVTLPSIEQATAEIVLQAVPSDGLVEGEPVTVTIVVTDKDGEGQDGAPVVTVNEPKPIPGGANVRFIAEGSDPQGGTLTYTWEQTGGPEAVLTPDAGVLWVRTPRVETDTTLTFKVTVTSSVSGLSASATASVEILGKKDGGGCGGCSSAGAESLVPAGLAFIAFALRRRRMKV